MNAKQKNINPNKQNRAVYKLWLGIIDIIIGLPKIKLNGKISG